MAQARTKILVVFMLATTLILGCQPALAQLRIVGTIAGSVHDPSGAVIPGAKIALKDESTGIKRETVATAEGSFVFPDLAHGLYELAVTAPGFQQTVVPHVQVVVGQTTDVPLTLRVGQASESVLVDGGIAPVLEASSNLTGMTQSTKLVSELPANTGRWPGLDVARLVPGYSNNRINNVVGGAMNTTLDGINNASNGYKSGGTVWYVAVNSRLGALDEVTVESGGLGADSGAQGAVNIKLITKRGTNQYHGSVFYQPNSEQFNANTFSNNAQALPRTKSRVHNFGGNFGGRMVPFGYLKDRLFFFVNYEYVWTPSAGTVTTNILTDEAKNGIYKYIVNGTTNQIAQVNVLGMAAAAGYPATLDPIVQSYMALNDKIKQYAVQVPSTALNTTAWQWNRPAPNYDYYPTTRVDYYITSKHQLSFTWNVEHLWTPGTPRFPSPDSKYTAPFRKRDFIWSGALQSTLSPTMFNELRYGRQHTGDTNASATEKYGIYNTYNGAPLRIGASLPFGTLTPYIDQMNTTGRHPILTMYDTFTKLQGQHTLRVGFTYRRTDWKDVSENFPNSTYSLGTPSGDPIPGNLFTTTTVPGDIATDLPAGPASLYNQLVGRVASASYRTVVDPDTKQFGGFIFYNWTRSRMGGFFVQDSWRVTPSLTFNYGMRWDMQGDQHDVLSLSAVPTLKDIYGPSVSLFTPGSMSGNTDPTAQSGLQAYKPDLVNVAPNFGFAWKPKVDGGFLGKVVGGSRTVLRGSYGVNYYDEGTLMYSGAFGCSPGTGIGCKRRQASQPDPAGRRQRGASPIQHPLQYRGVSGDPARLHRDSGLQRGVAPEYADVFDKLVRHEAHPGGAVCHPMELQPPARTGQESGVGSPLRGQSESSSVESRGSERSQYLRERFPEGVPERPKQPGHRQWRHGRATSHDDTEDQQFRQYRPTGAGSAADLQRGIRRSAARCPQSPPSTGYSSTTFANNLQTGAAGTLAAALTGQNYFCRMMGNSFAPCLRSGIAPTAGQSYDAPGAGYPINFFRLNPFTTTMNYADDSGWAAYNGLQIQLRKTMSHGLNATFNYSWSHSMSNTAADNANNLQNWTTWRNPSLDRRPSPFDLRHTISAFANYDLPIGSGQFFNLKNKWLDRIAGGWTTSAIVTFSTGAPSQLGGNYQTVNTAAATGVVLADGVSLSQISDMFHGQPLQKVNQAGNTDGRLNRAVTNDFTRLAVPLDLVGSDGRANPKYLTWNTTAGYLGQALYVYGKNAFSWNASITKNFRLTEKLKFQLYADAQNVMNHPSWGMGSLSLYSTSFGTVGAPTGSRAMTFRGLLSF